MVELTLSRQAQIDLVRLAEYGAERWGLDAADRFVATFDNAFVLIGRHPDIGRPRGELGPDFHSWSHRGYILYYEHRADMFEVRRILHASADPIFDMDD